MKTQAKRSGMSGERKSAPSRGYRGGTGRSSGGASSHLGSSVQGAGEAIVCMQELGITTRAELTKMGLEFSKSGELTSPFDKSMAILFQASEGEIRRMMMSFRRDVRGA